LWKSSPVNPWHAMFGIFPRCYITHHDCMHCFPIWECISCSPSAKLDLNRFRAKIIHYTAAGRDNS
jgi:hypothetical protein